MAPSNPFNQASKFFGEAYNNMEQASLMQERMQGVGDADTQYAPQYDADYLYGAVQPQEGPYGVDNKPVVDVDQVKEDLLRRSRETRSSNGSTVVRAGGGTNYAVKQ